MVLTVEPSLYIAPDADVPEQYRGIGIRIEDDIVITETGSENLTASVVKKPEEIEALMAAARSNERNHRRWRHGGRDAGAGYFPVKSRGAAGTFD
ncbi:hypothetical protein DMI70_20795 [Escherichia coli]|nr:hypothetical protein [Escherichia coli]